MFLAQLQYNLPIKWTWKTPWNSENLTEEDLAWNDSRGFQSREGIVALNDSFTQSVGLPSAQRWPWDKSKGIYFVEGVHALHCVVSSTAPLLHWNYNLSIYHKLTVLTEVFAQNRY
jgi:hypothetical protein